MKTQIITESMTDDQKFELINQMLKIDFTQESPVEKTLLSVNEKVEALLSSNSETEKDLLRDSIFLQWEEIEKINDQNISEIKVMLNR